MFRTLQTFYNNNNNNNNNNFIFIACIEYIMNYIKIFLQFTKKRKKGKYIKLHCNATISG